MRNCHRSIPIVHTTINRTSFATFTRFYTTDLEKLKRQSDYNEADNSVLNTGVIDKSKSEVLVYYDSIYPHTTGFMKRYFFWLTFPTSITDTQLLEKIKNLSSPLHEEAKITEFIPVKRDFGAFVKYNIPTESTASELIDQIRNNVEQVRASKGVFSRVFNLIWNHDPKVFTVKGTPWIEDLRRYPSSKLAVKYDGKNPLTEEELYVLFRRYGPINDIIQDSATSTSQILFRHTRSAIAAKQCLTGMVVQGDTVIHLQYIPVKRVNYITKFIADHTKIALPIILALLATFAVLIFDPIRQWFIEYKITHRSLENKWFKLIYIPYRTIKLWITDSFNYIDVQIQEVTSGGNNSTEDDTFTELKETNTFWYERHEKSKQLKLWIMENITSFIIVKGPPGSGKEEFIFDHTLDQDAKLNGKILMIHCDELSKARSDSMLMNNAASQLGYFPVFTWTNTFSQFADLGVQGLTGQKSGLNENKETRIKNMFSLTTQAIRKICDDEYRKYVRAIEYKNKSRKDGEKLEVLKQDEYLQHHPECKPIIVVNKFARRGDNQLNNFIFPFIAEWCAGLVSNNIAHVIFLTSDVGCMQHLTDALPNQVFKDISLSDASSQSAKQYVLDQLQSISSETIDTCIEPLGGRMLDLQSFIRRIKSGETPNSAIQEMINQSAELITTFFLTNHKIEDDDNNWNAAQVWHLMKLLSKKDSVSYNELVDLPLFKSSKETISTLSTLEKYDLVSLKRDKGVLNNITTGRPLFKAAFNNIIHDYNIWKLYESDYISNLISLEQVKIQKLEEELTNIDKLSGKLDGRIGYLVKKIEASSNKIVNYEQKLTEIKNYKPDQKSKSSFLGIF